MPCPRKEALARLFFNVTNTIKYFFLFFYLFSIFVAKIITYLLRDEDYDEYDDDDDVEDDMVYEYGDHMVYENEEEEEEDENVKVEQEEQQQEQVEEREHEEAEVYRFSHSEQDDHLVADIINGGKGLMFMQKNCHDETEQNLAHAHSNSYESAFEDPVEAFDAEQVLVEDCSSSDFDVDDSDGIINNEEIEEKHIATASVSTPEESFESIDEDKKSETNDHIKHDVAGQINVERKTEDPIKEESKFTRDEKFLDFEPPKSEAKKVQVVEKIEKEDIFGDTHTVGSTSKSSSEWRSSIRDSGTDDPFSSSSRRSCPKWESYTVYQKYDEEMLYLDRLSAQKLQETESLRSIQVEPRSISQRIVHKLAHKKQRSSERIYQNTYCELEAAYVAQICLTWEALNWNYANFQRKRASRTTEKTDRGCPAIIAQQFQQFQVLLQRFIETEPYERGRRPEIYARMRSVAPKLLQVPEYHDDQDEKEEVASSRITSEAFLTILEDGIRTFMNFLKADRESHCQVVAALFKRRRRKGSVDPALIQMVKKINKKKKLKLKELQRPRNCLRKRKLPREEEMEILMGLIDLKVASRVLRMADITQEQLHWCEGKMGKTSLLEGKFRRDSSPLFFPAH